MRTKRYSVAEWIKKSGLALRLATLPRGEWVPPSGTAALRFITRRPNVSQVEILCSHGRLEASLDSWRTEKARFASHHSECRISWTRLEFWPAAAAPVAGWAVTGTNDVATQTLLKKVHDRAAVTAEFVSANQCKRCIVGFAETAPIAHPDQVVMSVEHEFGCPERRCDG